MALGERVKRRTRTVVARTPYSQPVALRKKAARHCRLGAAVNLRSASWPTESSFAWLASLSLVVGFANLYSRIATANADRLGGL